MNASLEKFSEKEIKFFINRSFQELTICAYRHSHLCPTRARKANWPDQKLLVMWNYNTCFCDGSTSNLPSISESLKTDIYYKIRRSFPGYMSTVPLTKHINPKHSLRPKHIHSWKAFHSEGDDGKREILESLYDPRNQQTEIPIFTSLCYHFPECLRCFHSSKTLIQRFIGRTRIRSPIFIHITSQKIDYPHVPHEINNIVLTHWIDSYILKLSLSV